MASPPSRPRTWARTWGDETGMINVVISVGCWNRYARTARDSNALIIRGRVERAKGVVNLVADHLERLSLAAQTSSRDFR